MDILKELFKIGVGFLSLYIIGFERVIKRVKEKFFNVDSYIVEFWGSLVVIGKGYYIDKIIIEIFKLILVEIIWKFEFVYELYINGMKFIVFDKDKK